MINLSYIHNGISIVSFLFVSFSFPMLLSCYIIVNLSVVSFYRFFVWFIWSAVNAHTIILIFRHILSVVCFILSIYKVKCCMTNYDFSICNYYLNYNILVPSCYGWALVHHLLISFSNLSVTPLILSVSVSLTTTR